MKRIITVISGMFLLCASLMATGEPTVLCELMYQKANEAGTIEMMQVQAKHRKIDATLKNFKVKARILEISPAGIGHMPVIGYTLQVSIGKGETESAISVDLSSGYQRYTTRLQIGTETLNVNCDVD